MENFYFAQFTDIHIGTIVCPEVARLNLQWALNEVNSFDPAPQIILCTGDCVCNGSRGELTEFKQIMESSPIPYAALPANHDLWGESDDLVWQELIGPMYNSVSKKKRRSFQHPLPRGSPPDRLPRKEQASAVPERGSHHHTP